MGVPKKGRESCSHKIVIVVNIYHQTVFNFDRFSDVCHNYDFDHYNDDHDDNNDVDNKKDNNHDDGDDDDVNVEDDDDDDGDDDDDDFHRRA